MLRDVRFVRLIEGMCSLGSEFVWNFSPPSLMCGSPFFFAILHCRQKMVLVYFVTGLVTFMASPCGSPGICHFSLVNVTSHW